MRLLVPWLIVALFSVAPTFAKAQDAAAARRITVVLVRALAYDRKLRARAGDDVTIGVLYVPGAQRQAHSVTDTLQDLSATTVRGLPVRSMTLQWENQEQLERSVRQHQIDVLLLCGDDLLRHVPQITLSTRSMHVLTMTPSAPMVRSGAALGAQMRDDRIELMVNLPASRAEGAAFGTELLQLAEVLR